MTSVDQAVYTPIIDQLSRLTEKIMTSRPNALISPSFWPRYIQSVSSTFPDGTSSHTVFDDIKERNEYLLTNPSPTMTTRQEILQSLDSLCHGSPWHSTWHIISSVSTGHDEVVSTTLDWISSPYRQGPIRVFVAARLLRKCSTRGIDVGLLLLESLSLAKQKNVDDSNVFHLLSELVRSSTFSVAKYLQWLIARGGLVGSDDQADVC
jgi:mediator of RNA polymerase II transcription subunit 12